MRSQDNKNLVYICLAKNEHRELMNALNDLKKDFNFDIETHKIGEECNPKEQYQNKCFIFCADNQNDLEKLQQEHDKYENKMKNQYIILCCDFDASQWLSKFDAKKFIDLKNVSNVKTELRNVFNQCFQVTQQKGGVGYGQPEVSGQRVQQGI
jgi:hypothetical protein